MKPAKQEPTKTTIPSNPLFYDGNNFAGPIESLVRVSTILDLFQDLTSQEDISEISLSSSSVAGFSLLVGILQKTVDQSLEIISEENKKREGVQCQPDKKKLRFIAASVLKIKKLICRYLT